MFKDNFEIPKISKWKYISSNKSKHKKNKKKEMKNLIKILLIITLLIMTIKNENNNWIQTTTIYHVFVKQFGGDINKVTERLGYLKNLGIQTIWFMPIFESTSDHGYDTTNYYKIKSNIGTMEDLKRCVAKAHEIGLKVILDLVPNHWYFLLLII
jgi:alpha-amylase